MGSYLAIHSGEALLQLMPQIIHLILLQVQVSAAVSQNAFVAAGSGLGLLQLTAPALQPDHEVSVHVMPAITTFFPISVCKRHLLTGAFGSRHLLMQLLHNHFTQAVVSL